jgi:hypothetical protein
MCKKEVCPDLVSKTLVAETWPAPNTYRGSIVPIQSIIP